MSRPIPTQRPSVRRHHNPVTHEDEFTTLDTVQNAYERVCGAIEREMGKLSSGEVERLAERVALWALKMRRHRSDDEAGLLRELCLSLADRCEKQSELLSRKAEAAK